MSTSPRRRCSCSMHRSFTSVRAANGCRIGPSTCPLGSSSRALGSRIAGRTWTGVHSGSAGRQAGEFPEAGRSCREAASLADGTDDVNMRADVLADLGEILGSPVVSTRALRCWIGRARYIREREPGLRQEGSPATRGSRRHDLARPGGRSSRQGVEPGWRPHPEPHPRPGARPDNRGKAGNHPHRPHENVPLSSPLEKRAGQDSNLRPAG